MKFSMLSLSLLVILFSGCGSEDKDSPNNGDANLTNPDGKNDQGGDTKKNDDEKKREEPKPGEEKNEKKPDEQTDVDKDKKQPDEQGEKVESEETKLTKKERCEQSWKKYVDDHPVGRYEVFASTTVGTSFGGNKFRIENAIEMEITKSSDEAVTLKSVSTDLQTKKKDYATYTTTEKVTFMVNCMKDNKLDNEPVYGEATVEVAAGKFACTTMTIKTINSGNDVESTTYTTELENGWDQLVKSHSTSKGKYSESETIMELIEYGERSSVIQNP